MESPQERDENFPDWIIEKWQELTDVLADIIGVPSALIMKTNNDFIEVFVSSKTDMNPYHAGETDKLRGLYCETVIKTQNKLLISNATFDKDWDKNPDIKLGMIAYLGFPINFPNNQPFGTICVLDNKENHFSTKYEKLLLQFKKAIELDLALMQSFDIKTKDLSRIVNENQYQFIENNIELQNANEKTEESEELYRLLHENAGLGIGYFSPEGIVISFNTVAAKNMNGKPEDFSGKSIFDLFPKKEASVYYDRIKIALSSDEGNVYEDNVEILDEPKYFSNTSNRIVDSNGKILGVQIISQDITKNKQTEIELIKAKNRAEESELQQRAFLDNAVFAVVIVSFDGKLLYVNDTACKLFGLNKNELEKYDSKNLWIYPEHRKIAIDKVKTDNYLIDFETEFKSFNGTNITVLITSRIITFENEKVIFSVYNDISERKHLENSLIIAKEKAEESEVKLKNALTELNRLYDNTLRYQTLFENAIDGIFILDEKGNVVSVNQSYAEMHGYKIEELMKMSLFDIDTPNSKKQIPDRFEKLMKNGSIRFETEHFHKNGNTIILDVSACVFKSNNENFIVGFHHDITQKKRIETQIQQERVFAIIKGEENERTRISQELHDGLGPLMSTLKLFMQGIGRVEDPTKIKDFAQKAQSVFNEIMQTITEVSNNLSPHILRQFGLFTALKTYIDKTKKTSSINILLDFNYSHFQNSLCNKTQQLCKLSNRFDEIYEISLYRIITELIHNTTKHSKATEILIKIYKQNHSLFVIYTDNGTGFDKDLVLSHSNGLGFSNMQNRVKNINGTIKFESMQNKGFAAEIVIDCSCLSS